MYNIGLNLILGSATILSHILITTRKVVSSTAFKAVLKKQTKLYKVQTVCL